MVPFFNLDLRVMTTPQVILEVVDDDQLIITREFIDNGKLTVDGSGELAEIQDILQNNSGLSFSDSSVLELAMRVNGIVLSSDLKLRNATVRNGLSVRGILWIIDELFTQHVIGSQQAIEKLHLYLKINDRSPRNQIAEMIKRLTGH